MEYTFQQAPALQSWGQFISDWYVPDTPANTNCANEPQVGYFIGWENYNSIFQPVLAYQNDGSGVCNWSIFNQYNNGSVYGNPESTLIVAPGDLIRGALEVLSGTTFDYRSYIYDETSGGWYWWQVNLDSNSAYVNAVVTSEIGSSTPQVALSQCSQLPTDTVQFFGVTNYSYNQYSFAQTYVAYNPSTWCPICGAGSPLAQCGFGYPSWGWAGPPPGYYANIFR